MTLAAFYQLLVDSCHRQPGSIRHRSLAAAGYFWPGWLEVDAATAELSSAAKIAGSGQRT